MALKAILLDKDGTLLDFQASWGAWAVGVAQDLAQGDAGLLAQIVDALGLDLVAKAIAPSSVMVAGTPQDIGAVLGTISALGSPADLTRRIVEMSQEVEPVALMPLAPILQDLTGAGLTLGVATNDAAGPTAFQLDALGIADCFAFVAGFDSGYGGKPAPGQCLAFADAIAVPPGQIAMVGDSLHDMHAGRAAGMVCVAVTSGLAGYDDLAPAADVVLPDISHLPGWVRG